MSAIDRVVDYMAGLPQGAEHANTYATEFADRAKRSDVRIVDGVEEEKKMLSKGEKEVIGRLNCPIKFTRRNFDVDFNLGVAVSAEKKPFVRREKKIALDFLGSHEWALDPAKSDALYSAKESTVHLIDQEQRRTIMAKCPDLSGADAGGIFAASVHERISVPTDLRHLMMKMYLILQDYNLGVTSKSDSVDHAVLTYNLTQNIPAADRMRAVTEHRIVIDADGFTPAERGLLCLAGQEYPSTWYTHDNMYSKCNMEADDLVMVSSGAFTVDTSMVWGSPDRLYQMMWTVAAKLNSVEALISAFENMRGKCKMMADIVKRVPHLNRVNSMVPLSYCMDTAFGGDVSRMSVTKAPGFFSSSMALVSDLLYGMTFEAAATCVAESIGACGKLLSSATPRTNATINGMMRDYGLQHTNPEDNILLRNWDIMAGRPMTWDFGPILKDYVIELSAMIVNGADLAMPQILHAIPSLTAVNTAYGLSRGWRGPKETLSSSKKERADDSDGLAAFSWIMGERDVRPPVFFNRVGKKTVALGEAEFRLQAEADGDFGIGQVNFWIHDSLGGRVDENEEVASSLYRTEYAGTTCAMVFNSSDERWVLNAMKAPPGRQSVRGEKPPPDQEEALRVEVPHEKPQAMPWSGATPKRRHNPFKDIGTLAHATKVVPSKGPKHARIGSNGEPSVMAYEIDGNMASELVVSKRAEIAEGDTINFGIVTVPGDGQCGVHAVVEDLKIHGRLASSDVQKVHGLSEELLSTKSFHDAQELAALVQHMGYNMDLFDRDLSRVTRYGTHEGQHTVTVVKSGNHFDAAVLDGGITEMVVHHLEQQEIDSAAYVEQLAGYSELFATASM